MTRTFEDGLDREYYVGESVNRSQVEVKQL
jgi:hypothetical protein